MNPLSLRYGQHRNSGELRDFRSHLLRLFGRAQRKRVKLIHSNPKTVSEVLIASDVKGTFIESMIATPAWHPIVSTESVDGETWKNLSDHFHELSAKIDWRNRLSALNQKYLNRLQLELHSNPEKQIGSEEISRLVLRILFELVFREEISIQDEALFYQASLEWRKEIAVKGKADPKIKNLFWKTLQEQISKNKKTESGCPFHKNLSDLASAIAQPFIISPQINMSDILVSCFHYLRTQHSEKTSYLEIAQSWARSKDDARVLGIVLESIRLQHPFPILEREVPPGKSIQGCPITEPTQYFLLMDQFEQDPEWNPERWLLSAKDNPYTHFPFGAGKRMCLGKPIALEILKDMLSFFLTEIDPSRIHPEKGHLYSGRGNDHNASLREVFYQIKVFSTVIIKSIKKILFRRKKELYHHKKR